MTTIQRSTLLLSSKGDPSEQINKADELILELEKEIRVIDFRRAKLIGTIAQLGLMKHRINLKVIGWKEKF